MPHRTIFQWGKNHVHPFTMFVGGFVIGSLVTGAVAWAWVIAENSDIEIDDAVNKRSVESPKASASPSASVRPTASPAVSF